MPARRAAVALDVQSRRDDLKVVQDASPGSQSTWILSPVGTTEIPKRSAVPTGLLSDTLNTQDWRPGLLSGRPFGTELLEVGGASIHGGCWFFFPVSPNLVLQCGMSLWTALTR